MLLSVLPYLMHAQSTADSISITMKSAFESRELYDLASFQGIDGIILQFQSSALKGKAIELSYQVFDSGKSTGKAVLTTGLPTNFFQASGDTFAIKCLTQVRGDSVKVAFYYPRFNTSTHFTLRGRAEDYSLRYVAGNNGGKARVPLGKDKIAVMAYSLPYQPDKSSGQKFYCELTAKGVPPSQWWEKYGVPHCIVFWARII